MLPIISKNKHFLNYLINFLNSIHSIALKPVLFKVKKLQARFLRQNF